MRFAFMLVTRGNPQRAAATIEVAKSLASGEHAIDYIVGCDEDDAKTLSFFEQSKTAEVTIGPRPTGVGEVWNRCARMSPQADVYCPFPDDSFIALPDWDEYIASKLVTALAWNDLANPCQCTLPIVSRDWLNLVGGQLYDERFPFWFYDTCVNELHSFITGNFIEIPAPLILTAKKGLTQNLRDLSFWWDFYVATRKERIAQAAKIRDKRPLDPGRLAYVLNYWTERDCVGRASADDIERNMSAEGRRPPSPQYLRAKAAAEAYMNTRKAGL